MNLTEIPWTLVIFLATQTFGAIWFFSKMKADVDGLKDSVKRLEKENEDLKKELKEMMSILIKVEHNTTLLMMGRIKTGSREAA